jgi:hypothetical protein
MHAMQVYRLAQHPEVQQESRAAVAAIGEVPDEDGPGFLRAVRGTYVIDVGEGGGLPCVALRPVVTLLTCPLCLLLVALSMEQCCVLGQGWRTLCTCCTFSASGPRLASLLPCATLPT